MKVIVLKRSKALKYKLKKENKELRKKVQGLEAALRVERKTVEDLARTAADNLKGEEYYRLRAEKAERGRDELRKLLAEQTIKKNRLEYMYEARVKDVSKLLNDKADNSSRISYLTLQRAGLIIFIICMAFLIIYQKLI